MTVPVEIELKLPATPQMLKALREHPLLAGDWRTTTLATTYFDTPLRCLRQKGGALRIRQSEAGHEQTLKLPTGEGIRRQEWNVAIAGPVADDLPATGVFPERARAVLARLIDDAPLLKVATTRVERALHHVNWGSSSIEIACDSGMIEAGSRCQAICELELELVEGRVSDVFAFALQLPVGPDLQWSVTSKAERCYALAFDSEPAAIRAVPAQTSARMNVARGFQAIAWNCLGHLVANYPNVIATGNADAVHQSRVAIRRLRAAFSLFRDVVDDEDAPILRAELKAVAQALSPARDIHVLGKRIAQAAQAGGHDVAELLGFLQAREAEATRSAGHMLESAPFQRLLLQLAHWIEKGHWLTRNSKGRLDQPLPRFAAKALSRQRHKVRGAGKLADMSDAHRHRLRIGIKKLRYATEFVAPVFKGSASRQKQARYAKVLDRLQDKLGELNDLVMTPASADQLFTGLDDITAARLAAQMQEVLAANELTRQHLMQQAQKAYDTLQAMPRWWK